MFKCYNSGGSFNCTDPTSSVLFDGHIPTLTGLDGDMWASQLLTMSPLASTTEITFDFTGTVRVDRVEVVMFNCPQWGIGVHNIAAQNEQRCQSFEDKGHLKDEVDKKALSNTAENTVLSKIALTVSRAEDLASTPQEDQLHVQANESGKKKSHSLQSW